MLEKMVAKKGIPAVLCTDTYHHGYATEPVYRWVRDTKVERVQESINVPYIMVDTGTNHAESAQSKNWARVLLGIIGKHQLGVFLDFDLLTTQSRKKKEIVELYEQLKPK